MPLEYVSKKISFYCQYHIVNENKQFLKYWKTLKEPEILAKNQQKFHTFKLGLRVFNKFVKWCIQNSTSNNNN